MLSTTLPVAAGGNYTAQSPYSSSADATRLQLANSSGLELTVLSGTTRTTIPAWAAAVVGLSSASITVEAGASGAGGVVDLSWLTPADPLPIPNGPLSGATEITVTGTVDLAAGAEVTIDTSGGPVDVSATGTVDIGNTPAVTISGTPTVDIGNTPAVTISGTPTVDINSGTVDVGAVAGNVEVVNSGSVQFSAMDTAVIVETFKQAVDLAPGASGDYYLSSDIGGSIYVDELLIMISSPNHDIANLGISSVGVYVADPLNTEGYLGSVDITALSKPTSYDTNAPYDAVYVIPLLAPTWVGSKVVFTLVNNNASGGATINETLTITVYGKLTTQAVANASDTTLDVVQPVATNGQYAGLATTSTSDGDYVTVPQSTGALVLAASVRYSMSGSGTVEMEVVDDSSGDVLDHFTEVGPCTGGFSIDIPPGGFQLTGAIKLEQISNTGTPTGDVYVTAKWA